MTQDLLPESRMRRPVGSIRGPNGTLIPIYCANCGTPCGRVPEEHITFSFALCDPCSEKHGDPAHCMKEPDYVFWERVHAAQLEENKKKLGVARPLTQGELVVQLDDPTSLMSKLADEWRTHVLKAGR